MGVVDGVLLVLAAVKRRSGVRLSKRAWRNASSVAGRRWRTENNRAVRT
jgi:hypothetical protein